MGIIARIVLELAAGLLASMLVPGKRSQGPIPACHLATGQSRRPRRTDWRAHR
jgi:uncharacterized membrane protein YeaQ/YmgE (transglycosylase-associated protein family)